MFLKTCKRAAPTLDSWFFKSTLERETFPLRIKSLKPKSNSAISASHLGHIESKRTSLKTMQKTPSTSETTAAVQPGYWRAI